MALEEVVELGVQEWGVRMMAKAGMVEWACHSHPLTPQLCLQSGVEGMEDTCQVRVLLMAQVLGA
jgi:hypothetical protein